MKQSIYFSLFLLIFHYIDINAIEVEKNKFLSISLYANYFIIKESCAACLYACFLDMNKVKNTKVGCSQCDYNLDSMYLWGHCASSVNEITLNKLKELLWDGSTEELAAFLLVSFQDLHIKCPECFEYKGWYILE